MPGAFGVPQQPPVPADPTIPPGAPPGMTPGMPGYSWQQSQQTWAAVNAEAGPAVPMSPATIVAAVAGFGALLMIVGSFAPWVKVSFGSLGQSAGGLHRGLDGPYLLGMGVAALLAAGAAVTSQANRQVRQISAGVLVLLGGVGLGIVIHEWTHVTHAFNALKSFANQLTSTFPATTDASGSSMPLSTEFSSFLSQFHVTKGWGLMLCGVASSVTALAGAYLFLV